MKHVPVTFSDAAQPIPSDAAALVGTAPYDPIQERMVARRLRGARWRRLFMISVAVAMAAGTAAVFTMSNREMIEAELTPAPVMAVPAAVPEAPALASSQSRPVSLPGTEADPNKAQARVIVPADPVPPVATAGAPTDPAPLQMRAPAAAAPRSISLPGVPPQPGAPAAEEDPALPGTALGFAPLPAPRPARAP